ncbi:MAG: hypothetical protein GEU75_08355 [Dehalococcoidia bacterium]|nr:hypothetical protein [Dehalococcoidia bacterium]
MKMESLSKFFRRERAGHRLYWLTTDIAIAREPADADLPGLHAAGVRGILDLRAEMPERSELASAAGLRYLRVPVVEGDAPTPAELRLATGWVKDRIAAEGPVLVHCREGRGRSAMVACATLVGLGIPLFDAYQALRRARPDVALNDVQDEALRLFSQSQS